MATDIQQLESLGWKALDEGQSDDRYYLLAGSCGHFIMSLADTRTEAWSAARSMAMKLTRGDLRLPRF